MFKATELQVCVSRLMMPAVFLYLHVLQFLLARALALALALCAFDDNFDSCNKSQAGLQICNYL